MAVYTVDAALTASDPANNQFKTIQEAIDAARGADPQSEADRITIEIKASAVEYTGVNVAGMSNSVLNLKDAKFITLAGAGAGNTVFRGQINVANSEGITIENMTITADGTNSAEFTGNGLIDARQQGVKDLIIRNNVIALENCDHASAVKYDVIDLYTQTGSKENVTISGNTISGGCYSIRLDRFNNGATVIADNVITGSQRAINVDGMTGTVEITGNSISNVLHKGIQIAGTAAESVTISENTIQVIGKDDGSAALVYHETLNTTSDFAVTDNSLVVTTQGMPVIREEGSVVSPTQTNNYMQNADGTLADGSAEPETSVAEFLVSADWSEITSGGVVSYNGKFYTIGTNAFGDAKAALNAANTLGGTLINLTETGYVYAAPQDNDAYMVKITNAGTYNITGGKGVLLNYEVELNPDKADGEYIINMTDANLTATKLTLRNNAELNVTNSRIDYNQFQGGSAYLSVYTNSVLNINNSVVGYNPYASKTADPEDFVAAEDLTAYWAWGTCLNVYGTADIKDSDLFIYVGQGNQAGFDVLGNGTATLTNSNVSLALLNVGGDYTEKYLAADADKDNLVATLTLDNSRVKNTQYRGDYNTENGINVGNAAGTTAGKLTIKNGSDIDFTVRSYNDAREIGLRVHNGKSSVELIDSTLKVGSVSNAGTVSIDGSSLNVKTVTNNGSISVTGNSKLNIESLTGNVNLVDGANLSDSVIGSGTVVTTGNVTLSGNVTLDKFNAVDGEGDAGNSVTIAAGADVRLNGEVRIRTNDVVHIYGALTVGDAADFYKKNGSEMTIYKDGVLTLEDSSFQNNSLLTVYGEMNLNYVNGWAPKLAGNETGKYSGQLVVDGKDGKGIVNVKAPFLTFGGGLGSAWKEAADGCTVDILNNGKIVTDAKAFWNSSKNTLTLNHGSLIFDAANSAYDSVWQADAKFDNDGVMSGSNSSVIDMSGRTFTNNGSVTLADSTLTAGTLVNNSTVNVSGADSAVKAVFSGSGSTVFTDVVLDADWAVSGSQGEWRFLGDSTVAQAMEFDGRVYAGTLQTADETDFSGVASSTLAINADFSASALWIGAQYADGITDSKTSTVTVNSGSVLTVDGESSGLVIRESGILNIIDGSSLRIGHDRQVMIQGALTVDGAGSLFETASSPVNIYKDHAVLTVSNGGKAVFGSYNDTNIRIGTGGEIVLKSGILVLNDTLNINDTGSFSMDYLSTVSFAETINVAATASLTIDTTGFTDGIYKLMDYTGTGSYSEEQYKVLLGSNWDDACYSVIDNDLYLMNVDMTTVKVDAAWAGSEFGAEVEDDYYYGFNAFSDFAESVQVLASKPDTTTTFLLKGNLTTTDDLEIPYGSGDVKFLSADGNEVVVEGLTNDKSNFSFTEGGVSPVITIGENVTFKMLGNNSDFSVWYGANLDLYGTLQGVGGWNALYQYVGTANVYSTGSITMGRIQAPSAQVNIYGTSENMAGETVSRYSSDLAVKDRADAQVKVSNLFVEADPWGSSTTKKGEFNAYDTFVSAGTVHDSNNGTVRGDGTVAFTIDHSKFVASSITLKRTDTVFALQNGSYVEVSSNLDNSGLISMDYTSTLAFGSLVNSGTITVDTAGFSSGVYKIFDDLTGSYTETEYRSLLGDANWNDSYKVIDNDLYLTNLEGAELYVDSAWASMSPNEEVTFVDGTKAYYKLNAFDTVANALALPSGETAYENAVKLNITGAVKSNISVIGSNITEVNSAAKTADENAVIAEDALTVNLVQVDNTEAGWEVYYPLASGSSASVYGGITTNFVSGLFTFETTRDPNIIGGAYGASDAKIYGSTTVNIGTDGGSDSDVGIYVDALVGSGGGTINGNSSVNIYSGTIERTGSIIGGSSWGGVVKGDSSVNIYGGNLIDSSDGKSKRGIMGGSYNGVTEGNASVNIYGGTVNGRIYAGGSQAGTTVKGNASVNISDGVVNGSIYGTGGVVEGSISISVTGGTIKGNIYAGGLNVGVAGTKTVNISDYSNPDKDNKNHFYGGSSVTQSGTADALLEIVDGDVIMNVADTEAYADIFGGASVTKSNYVFVEAGSSDVTVKNLLINGYDSGKTIWTGRVYGAGQISNSGNSSVDNYDVYYQASSNVHVTNIGGITVNKDDGSVTHNPGARVYGGGYLYWSRKSELTVGSTNVVVDEDLQKDSDVKTELAHVIGGSLISGTIDGVNASTIITGNTDVTVNAGVISAWLVGGNNSNWFGRSVIGVADENGAYEYNGEKYSAGSTKVTLNDGGSETLSIIGGSLTDYASYYEAGRLREAVVFGKTEIIMNGGTAYEAVGGGYALYQNQNADTSGKLTGVENPLSNVEGETNVTVNGGTIKSNVIGGGYAYSNQAASLSSIANVTGNTFVAIGGTAAVEGNVYGGGYADGGEADVTGNTSVNVTGGTVAGNIYGGGYHANVNGNATVTITGGTVSGDIYGSGEGEATVNGSRTLNLGSADAAAYAATLNNVYDFNVAQIVNADVTVTGDFSVEEITIAGATLTLNSGFLAATTAVTIEVGAYNMAAAALNVGVSGVNQPSITISAAEELTAGRYLVASGFDSLSGFTVDGINGYTLRLQGEDVYLTRDLAPDDYDANGRPDILMQHDIGKLQVSLVQEDQSVILKDVADLGDGWTILGSGQSGNGENYADIYLTNGETVGIWQLDETTGVTAWQEIQSFDSATHVLGLGDFNGDGITDLLLQNDNGAVGAYLTDGENVGWNYFQSLGSEWSIAGIGDFNHDGIDDVVLQNEKGGYAGIWQLDRDGQVSWSDLDVLNNGQIAGTGDFNGDGFDDVLLKWGNSYGAWTVSGGNLSGWMDLGTLWDSAALEQIGDFNGDGIDDLRVRITNGDLGAFCVLGEGNLQWNYHFSVGSEWQTNLVSI